MRDPRLLLLFGLSAQIVRSRRAEAAGDPVNLAATTTALIMAGLAVAGTATAAVGAYSQAQSQKAAADFNSKVAQNNTIAAEQQASADAAQVQQRSERLRGAQAAAMAKAGVSGGSAGDVTYDTSTQQELDRLMTMYRGHIEGENYRSQSTLFDYQGKSAMTAGYLNTGSTILSGSGNALRSYSSVRNNQPDFGYG